MEDKNQNLEYLRYQLAVEPFNWFFSFNYFLRRENQRQCVGTSKGVQKWHGLNCTPVCTWLKAHSPTQYQQHQHPSSHRLQNPSHRGKKTIPQWITTFLLDGWVSMQRVWNCIEMVRETSTRPCHVAGSSSRPCQQGSCSLHTSVLPTPSVWYPSSKDLRKLRI